MPFNNFLKPLASYLRHEFSTFQHLTFREKPIRFRANSRSATSDGQAMISFAQKEKSAISSWKESLVETFGRELHALRMAQEERAFFATNHGRVYTAPASVE